MTFSQTQKLFFLVNYSHVISLLELLYSYFCSLVDVTLISYSFPGKLFPSRTKYVFNNG